MRCSLRRLATVVAIGCITCAFAQAQEAFTDCSTGATVDTSLVFKFDDYSAGVPYRGRPAYVQFASHQDARRFRTRLREGIAQGSNFAGRFRVVTWGCGTACRSGLVVNVETGHVYELPHASNWTYRLGSTLLVLDGPSELWEPCKPAWIPPTRYLIWTGSGFEELLSP